MTNDACWCAASRLWWHTKTECASSLSYRIRFADGSMCDEGPWDTRADAQRFLDAEVGVPAEVVSA